MPVLVPALVFVLLIAGCASTPKEPAAGAADAAKLVKDINAIKAESAKADGNTVTLTGGIRLETALTIPAGVTLDLTKETLQLANNAVFTVEGTVNAKADGITIDSAAANPATVNGSGTIQLKSKGNLFVIWDNKKLILDGVTLVGLKDNDGSLVEFGGSEFVLKSGKITGNHGHGVKFYDGGTFTMEVGEISGNGDGGVIVFNGSFTMSGGTIANNSRDNNGGGVYLAEGASFIMEGGTIYGNADSLPAGTDPSLANSARVGASLAGGTAKWGTGGTYTKGGKSQPGGSDIGSTNDTLIAIPKQ